MHRKIICFLLIITVFSASLEAQFSKGTRILGATIGSAFFSSGEYTYTVPPPTIGSSETTNSLGLNLSPSLGWFISDQTVIGAQLLVGYRYDKNLEADINNVTYYKNISKKFSIMAGGFVRNYFSATGRFLPFAQASFNIGIGSANHEGFNYSATPLFKDTFKGESSGDFSANAGLSMGFTKMLNEHVGLDIIAGYLYSYNKTEYLTNTQRDVDIDGSIDENGISDLTTKFTNHGFSISVGVQVFLFRNKKP